MLSFFVYTRTRAKISLEPVAPSARGNAGGTARADPARERERWSLFARGETDSHLKFLHTPYSKILKNIMIIIIILFVYFIWFWKNYLIKKKNFLLRKLWDDTIWGNHGSIVFAHVSTANLPRERDTNKRVYSICIPRGECAREERLRLGSLSLSLSIYRRALRASLLPTSSCVLPLSLFSHLLPCKPHSTSSASVLWRGTLHLLMHCNFCFHFYESASF